MSDILIKGMDMPKACCKCPLHNASICVAKDSPVSLQIYLDGKKPFDCPLIEIPTPHGRLIDAEDLRRKMYRETFETDNPMMKWDSGCWIRYKMFEKAEENAPTIIEAEG